GRARRLGENGVGRNPDPACAFLPVALFGFSGGIASRENAPFVARRQAGRRHAPRLAARADKAQSRSACGGVEHDLVGPQEVGGRESVGVGPPLRRLGLVAALFAATAYAQTVTPTNSAPNPYRAIENWGKLPDGRSWGSTSGVDVDPDGTSVWVAERCGAFAPPSLMKPGSPFACSDS